VFCRHTRQQSGKQPHWLHAAYRWGLAHSNAKWLLAATDSSYVRPSAVLAHLEQLTSQGGGALQRNEVLTGACVGLSAASRAWQAVPGVVTRAFARTALRGAGKSDSQSRVKCRASPAHFVQKSTCSSRGDLDALVIGQVVGPIKDKRYSHANLGWCHALQRPGVLAGTLSAPQHLPLSRVSHAVGPLSLYTATAPATTLGLYPEQHLLSPA